jgi:DNA-binding winged helix-turn-helix (wHTH) protein/Tol biopolymer transport system component
VETPFQIGPWLVSPKLNQIARNGKTIHLEPKIMSVLVCLAEHKCEVVSKEQLFATVWPDAFVTDDVLKRSISELRKALGDDTKEPRFIETIPKGGYRLLVSVSLVAQKPDSDLDPGRTRRRWPFGLSYARVAFVGSATVALILVLVVWLRSPLPARKTLRYTQLTNDGSEKSPPILTDGSRIYFGVETTAGRHIAQVSTRGGEVSPIPTPFQVVDSADISPSGSELLVGNFFVDQQKEEPVFVLPLPGGSPRRLGNVLSRGALAWSPDGKEIAYLCGADMCLVKSDGTDSRKVATLPESLFASPDDFHWSPDGKLVRFRIDTDKRTTLWEISVDGTDLHQILEHWDRESRICCSNWTPDGKYYIFQSYPFPFGPVRIWAIAEKRGFLGKVNEPVLLTEIPMSVIGTFPSRDGKRLFLHAYVGRMELVSYNETSRQFVPYLSGLSGWGFAFSKEGEWVSYSNWVPPTYLWRSKPDGSQRLQLSSPGTHIYGSSWSPDGRLVAFSSGIEAEHAHIYVTSFDGGSPQQLTRGERPERWPDWSPDGNLLLFGNAPHENEPETTAAVHIFDFRTRQVYTVPGSEGLIYARWSPDGRFIAASGHLHGEKKLSLFDCRTQKWMELATGRLTWPTWSRDGRYVYVRSTVEGESYLARVRIADRAWEPVASLKDLKQREGRFLATWIGLSPDGSPLALRDLSSSEIYALDWELP